jgi:hypothetical protein
MKGWEDNKAGRFEFKFTPYHVPSLNLMTGWRGEMKAEEEKKIGKLLHVKARSHLVISSEEMSYNLQKSWPRLSSQTPCCPHPLPQEKKRIKYAIV